ncbi:PGAP3/PER1 family protein [Aspergillus tanneri]|uniref:Post-GPI attachment to proteins factor 3 n=1 Tax=Aspergillus tanneri TaxID=1220188 RepID=A0A5M9MCW9_9EURO|nr:uncharacterized protein ATNIH1004_008989 [Aspergillus tanneri]KAA8644781.1 hypothetical protein ATNIH1004_008989 [Aspergillus tanneri]
MVLGSARGKVYFYLLFLLVATFIGKTTASLGDHLPDFKECVKICQSENCQDGNTALPFHLRLLLWTCPAECDYTCQHVVTDRRVALCWTFSMLFHTRDFPLTEKLDYFGAGANVMYGLYLAVIRIFRLDQEDPRYKPTLRRLLTAVCLILYTLHVCYLSFWSWDYTYNMIANIVIGMTQNVLWTAWGIIRYRKTNRFWTVWPALIVVWIILAMSLELLDFAPWKGLIDAHSLWHLGTVIPAAWWYLFLVKDIQDDVTGIRLKT